MSHFRVFCTVVADDADEADRVVGENAMVEGVPDGCEAAVLINLIRSQDSSVALLGSRTRRVKMFLDAAMSRPLSGKEPVPRCGGAADTTDVFLHLLGRLPAAGGGAAASTAAGGAGLLAAAGSMLVSRYADIGKVYDLRRPSDFAGLVSTLELARLFRPGDGICYFVGDEMSSWGDRIKVKTPDDFAGWLREGRVFTNLPRLIIYPRDDGVSPAKGPSQVKVTDDNKSTSSSKRRILQDDFRMSLRSMDSRCVFPGCPKEFRDASGNPTFDEAKAAHIISNALVDARQKDEGSFYYNITRAAEIGRVEIDTARNGMLLCSGHHDTFDKYRWTIDPDMFDLVVSEDASQDYKNLLTAAAAIGETLKVNFNHRQEGFRPTRQIWRAYNTYVYSDKGARLDAATGGKAKKVGGASSAGGSAAGASSP